MNSRTHTTVPTLSTTLSVELRASTGLSGLTVSGPPQGARSWLLVGAALASGVIYALRKSYSNGIRRRVIRRLDDIAPRIKFHRGLLDTGKVFNADCEYSAF